MIQYTCDMKLLPKKMKRVSCEAIKLHSSFWETTAKRKDYLHLYWQSSCCRLRRLLIPTHCCLCFSQRNCALRTKSTTHHRHTRGNRQDKFYAVQLTVGLRMWTCRQSRSEWQTQWAWCECLWAGGSHEEGGGTLLTGRPGLKFPFLCHPPSPAGCSANSSCIQCNAGCSIWKCLWQKKVGRKIKYYWLIESIHFGLCWKSFTLTHKYFLFIRRVINSFNSWVLFSFTRCDSVGLNMAFVRDYS